jgi:hypothetical protein
MSAFVHGVYLAGATGLLATGLYATAAFGSGSGTVEATVNITEAVDTVQAEGTLGPNAAIAQRFVFGLYVKLGALGQISDGKFLTTGYGFGGTEGVVAQTEAVDTLLGEGTTGVVGVNASFNQTEAVDTLSGAGTTTGTVGTFNQTESVDTLSSGSEVVTLLLAGSVQADVGAVLAQTEGVDALVSDGSVSTSGSITAGFGQIESPDTLASTSAGSTAGTFNVTEGNDGVTSGIADIGDRSIDLSFIAANGVSPAAGVYQYAFFEAITAGVLGTPSHTGATLVESSGRCVIVLAGSNLASGETGYLVISDGDGDPTIPFRSFCGPVRVL